MLQVVRWDAIIEPKSSPKTGLYIVPPTQDMANFLLSGNQFAIKITDTNSGYDNILCFAVAIPSEIAGGYRPNYEAQTNTIVIMPLIAWDGYPPELGNVTILDYGESTESYASELSHEQVKESSMQFGQIVFLLLFTIFVYKALLHL